VSAAEGGEVALVHDYLLFLRGAERTFSAIADTWPGAPIYAGAYSEEATEGRFAGREIHTSWLQRPGVNRHTYRALLPLWPRAIESLPLGDHPVVVSSSFAFAHGVRPGPDAVHVCYCHSPFRYVWHENEAVVAARPAPARPLVRRMLRSAREWDLKASRRVTRYIANSRITQRRIQETYGRDAEVIHPPVEVDRFRPGADVGDHLLFVGELVAHKRADVALEAARIAGRPIKVVGGGPELRTLQRAYGDSAEFLGRVSDAELARIYPKALALVVPNVEEFGIAAVEAQASGRPVLARRVDGATECVVDGVTGVLVEGAGPRDFAEAMAGADFRSFSPEAARANAERFAVPVFRAAMLDAVARARAEGTGGPPA
jgi:glycosyltransferase involved in cell wall biosynthesis